MATKLAESVSRPECTVAGQAQIQNVLKTFTTSHRARFQVPARASSGAGCPTKFNAHEHRSCEAHVSTLGQVPALRVLEVSCGERDSGPLILRPMTGNPIDRRDAYRMVVRIANVARIQRTSVRTRCDIQPSPLTRACRFATRRSWHVTLTHELPNTTTGHAEISTVMQSTSRPPMSPASSSASGAPRKTHFRGTWLRQ